MFYLLAWLVFPCLQLGDPVARLLGLLGFSVREVSVDILIKNYWIVKVICFLFSNGIVYLLNILYVFESGRHHRVKEMTLFFSISAVVFVGGASLALGFVTRVSAGINAVVMLGAVGVHVFGTAAVGGLFSTNVDFQLAFMVFFTLVLITWRGAGPMSLDRLLGEEKLVHEEAIHLP